MSNALFIKRLCAIIIDIILISLIANLVSYVFIDQESVNKINNEEVKLLKDYQDNKIDMETFTKEAPSITYQSNKLLIPYNIIYIFIAIIYFIIYQAKTGQTLGKKLLKIKIKADDGDLNMNQMVVRGLIIDGIFFKILDLAIIMFLSKAMYLNAYSSIQLVEYVLFIAIALMVMFRKDRRGLHDIVCHTKVVSVK